MKSVIFLSLIAFKASTLYCQQLADRSTKKDSVQAVITAFEDNKDGSLFTGMYEIYKGIQPVSYVSLFPFYLAIERPIALREGEGKNGYLLEGNIDQTFTLLQGRNQAQGKWQRFRLAFRYSPAIRMTLDSSNPIYPSNQKVGFELSYAVWDSYTTDNGMRGKKEILQYDTSWIEKRDPFCVIHLIMNAMHYSNGQRPGSIFNNSPRRNDYLKGDFSTNYLSLMAIYSTYTSKHQLYSLGIGYRLDGELGDAFAFNTAQNNRYGKQRVLFLAQLRTQPRWTFLNKKFKWIDLKTGKNYLVQGKLGHRFRIESELVLGSMLQFDRTKTYRLGTHFFYEMDFFRWRTAGIVFHFYRGRDYFNIRYDDIVYGGGVGMSFNLLKYKPPRLKSSSYIRPPFNTR
jgi:hypothetical protein